MPLDPKTLKPGTVLIHEGGGQTHIGESATRRFQIITVIAGLELEMKGIRLSGRVSCLKAAKRITGNRTNNRATQIQLLQALRKQLEENITIEAKKDDL